MKFLHYFITLPLIIFAVYAVYLAESSAEGVAFSLWPQDCVNIKLVLTCFLAWGYLIGRITAWFEYSPLRSDLRRQKKANKALNKEQVKLNETVSGLKVDIAGLQEKAKQSASLNAPKESEKNPWWKNLSKKASDKKGI